MTKRMWLNHQRRFMRTVAVVCAAVFTIVIITALPAAAQSASADRGIVAVIPGRMLNVKTGAYATGDAIIIQRGLITAIVAADRVPADAKVIRLPNLTVLPGLIDAHTHITYDPTSFGYPALGISIPRQALIGAKNARITLEAGFTTIRNVHASGFTDVALRDAIDAGELPGP